jgi:hypothetical protein
VGGVDRFALCKFVKGRGEYVVLDESKEVGGTLANWERVFVRFRDGTGEMRVPCSVLVLPFTLEQESSSPWNTPQ